MTRRPHDWLAQAEHDIALARGARELGHFEWACFASQQAAEKALKGLWEAEGVEVWGHSVLRILEELRDVPLEVMEAGRRLDRHYIGARYPNAHPAGSPADVYTKLDADQAIADATAVIEHVRGRLP